MVFERRLSGLESAIKTRDQNRFGVEVRQSNIDGAEEGLFATKKINPETLVALFQNPKYGKNKSVLTNEGLQQDQGIEFYTSDHPTGVLWDDSRPKPLWYYMNHSNNPNVIAVRLYKETLRVTTTKLPDINPEKNEVTIGFKTRREVKKGEELLFDYGQADPAWNRSSHAAAASATSSASKTLPRNFKINLQQTLRKSPEGTINTIIQKFNEAENLEIFKKSLVRMNIESSKIEEIMRLTKEDVELSQPKRRTQVTRVITNQNPPDYAASSQANPAWAQSSPVLSNDDNNRKKFYGGFVPRLGDKINVMEEAKEHYQEYTVQELRTLAKKEGVKSMSNKKDDLVDALAALDAGLGIETKEDSSSSDDEQGTSSLTLSTKFTPKKSLYTSR